MVNFNLLHDSYLKYEYHVIFLFQFKYSYFCFSYKVCILKSIVTEILLSGGEDHVREFLQELKTSKLNEEDVIAGECSMYHIQNIMLALLFLVF